MTRIIKIGMDVHKDSFTLCAMEPKFGGKDTVFSTIKTGPHADLVVDYIDHIREKCRMTILISNVDMKLDAWDMSSMQN